MKSIAASLFKVLQTWTVILSIIFVPFKSFAQSEAEQLELPLQTNIDRSQTPEQPRATRTNENGEEVIARDRNGIEITRSRDNDTSNTRPGAQTEVNDPASQQRIDVETLIESDSTEEQRRAASPKSLMRAYAEATRNIGAAGLRTGRDTFRGYDEQVFDMNTGKFETRRRQGLAVQTAMHFPAEASTFYAAMGILAMAELNNPLRSNAKNPASIDQFIHHSFFDPIGAISFYAFMLVNRQTGHFFQQLGIPGNHANATHFRRIKGAFNHLAPQLGMSAGFLAQTLLTEIAHDREAQICVGRWGIKQIRNVMGRTPNSAGAGAQAPSLTGQILAPNSPEIMEACEAAYDRWAVRQKIKDLEPMIYAMIATNVLQAYSVPFARHVARTGTGKAVAGAVTRTPVVGAVVKGLSLTIRKGAGFFPQGGLAIKIVNIVAFIKIQELVQPWFNRTFGSPRKADDLSEITNKFERKLIEASQRQWAPGQYRDRTDQRANDPVELLKTMSAQYQGFRQYNLQLAFMNYQNWQQALTKFQATYVSSYAMYDRLIREVRDFKQRGTMNRYQGPVPSGLFLSRESPTYRVGTLIPKRLAGPIASDPLRNVLNRIREYYHQNQNRLTQEQKTILSNVNLGLESAYRDLSAQELDAAIRRAGLTASALSAEQRQSIAVEVRAHRVSQALKILTQTTENIRNTTGALTRVSNGFRGLVNEITGNTAALDFNAFFWHIRSALGNLDHAVTVPGFDYYHRQLGRNTDIVPELAQQSAPSNFDRAHTPTMSDYLLASMVCGPKSKGGAAGRQQQTSLYSRAMNLWNQTNTHRQVFERLSLVEYTPGSGFKFLPPRLVQDSIADANFCGRVPGRAKVHNIETGLQEFITGRSNQRQSLSIRNYFNVNTGEFRVNNQTHEGFLPLVKYYMNPEFLAAPTGDTTPFFNFWVRDVEPQVKRAIVEFGKMYRQLVFEDFVPNFVSGQYQTHNGRKVHFGAGLSIREEGNYYNDLMKRLIGTPEMEVQLRTYKRNLELAILMFSKPEQVRQATGIILNTMRPQQQQASAQVTEAAAGESDLSGLDVLAGLVDAEQPTIQFTAQQIAAVRTAADPAAQAATALLMQNLRSNIDAIKRLVESSRLRTVAKAVAQQMVRNMEQVAGEADSYNGVIRAVNLQGLPEASDI